MYYPSGIHGTDKISIVNENLAIQLYGKRIYEGQTVGEYLLEFLLVFLGANNGDGGFSLNINNAEPITYKTNPNIGLKRFIFFENSKSDNRHKIDKEASEEINRLLMERFNSDKFTDEEILYQIKDLFYGFNLITKQRSWFAQSMMPLCEELVFCEAQNNISRKAYKFIKPETDLIDSRVDKDFAFTKHSFLARGGEVYYMHLLQGFQEMKDTSRASELSREIEYGLRTLLKDFPQFSLLSKHIQDIWEKYLSVNMEKNDENINGNWVRVHHERKMVCDWIKDSYGNVAMFSIIEIRNILSASINQLEKLELLNIGIVLQIFRLMINEAYIVSKDDFKSKPIWVIQVPAVDKVDEKVKKLCVKHYSIIENYMTNALSNQLTYKKSILNENTSRLEDVKLLKDAYKNSHKLLRKIGKDIGLIIPVNGKNMRLTISDDILKYFVLSIIEPESSVTLDTFLENLYSHYGIIIREEEYIKHFREFYNEEVYAPYLDKNFEEFSIQLKNNGYLKELSDATAIVTNPYETEGLNNEIY